MSRFYILAALVLACSSGCATIISGTHENVRITSRTPGIKVYVDDKAYRTPVEVALSRGGHHKVNFPNGRVVRIEHSWFGNPVVLLDALWIVAGLVPWLVVYITDVATGAYKDLEPDDLYFDDERGVVIDEENGEYLE